MLYLDNNQEMTCLSREETADGMNGSLCCALHVLPLPAEVLRSAVRLPDNTDAGTGPGHVAWMLHDHVRDSEEEVMLDQWGVAQLAQLVHLQHQHQTSLDTQHTREHTREHTCGHTRGHTCGHTRGHTCGHTREHTRGHTRTHTHTHTHLYRLSYIHGHNLRLIQSQNKLSIEGTVNLIFIVIRYIQA